MNVIVTGGAGFIGSVLVKSLLEKQNQVTIFDDFSNSSEKKILPLIEKGAKLVKGDIRDFELLKKSVRPEFLNRVDELIMFHTLSKQDLMKIVNIQFGVIQKRLEENGVQIEISDKALKLLAEMGYDPQFGARPLKRVMQREILNELSKEILADKVHKDSIVGIDVNDQHEFEFMNLDDVKID